MKTYHIPDEMIHPELRESGKWVRRFLPYFKHSTFRKANRILKLMKGRSGKDLRYEQVWIPRAGGSEGVRHEQDRIPGAGGPEDPKLRLCVYRSPEFSGDAPGLLWMHGGGYGLGIPEVDEGAFREFIRETGCVIVAPDYRLSVEKPYPAALEDCYAALLWLKDHASSLGVRENQLMVGGFSAGGGLAAALSIYARDKGEVSIAFQMPIYPMLDDRMITGSSRENDAPVWNTRSNETGWRLYLGSLFGTEEVPAYAAPARLSDHRGLPPAFTFVGSIEPFRDETVDYMERLKEAGVPVNYKVFDGCFHAFDIFAKNSAPAIEARKRMTERLRYAAEHYFAEQEVFLAE
ncbi:MAG: alpha/beta hydrolase [Clostridiales bacterium]|nr:alpha/beta hydrolase [Clostridiales bacterium]